MSELIQQKYDYEQVKKLDLKQKKPFAKEHYYRHIKAPQIAQLLDIKLPTLKAWIYGTDAKKNVGWKIQREIDANELLRNLSVDKKSMVYKMVDNTLFLLHDYVEKTKDKCVLENETITLVEATKLTKILSELHAIIADEKDIDDDADFKKPADINELKERINKADVFDIDLTNSDLPDTEDSEEVIESDDDIVIEEDTL